MKTLLKKSFSLSLMTVSALALAASPAQADSSLPNAMELTGITKVFNLIGNVNLTQNDVTTDPGVLNMLELKSDVEAAPTRVSLHARRLPPNRRPKTF